MARHDLSNDESLRYLEDRLRSMGVIKSLEAAGFEPGDDVEIAGTVFELRSRAAAARADPARTLARMASVVVKLGSSIVADLRGEVRLDVLAPGVRGGGRAPPRGRLGGAGHLGRDRPRDAAHGSADAPGGDGRAPGRLGGGPGPAVPRLRRAAGRRRGAERAGAAHVLRHVGPHALPERAPHAAQAARLARGAGDQRERHHHHRRDLLRRQRLPRRPGGDPRWAPTGCVLLTDTDGLYTADPARDPIGAAHSPRCATSSELEGLEIGVLGLAARLGRACARRWWQPRWRRRRDPRDDRARHGARSGAGGAGAARPPARASTPQSGRVSSFKLWLQVRQAHARARSRSTRARSGRCASGARACCRWASWGCAGSFEAGRRGGGAPAGRRRAPDRQGDRQLLGRGAAPRSRGMKSDRRCASCCRGPPRRPFTGTTSSSRVGAAVCWRGGRYPTGPWPPPLPPSPTSALAAPRGIARARARWTAPRATLRCTRWPTALEERAGGDPGGQRARHGGRAARRTSARAARPAASSTRGASRASPRTCADRLAARSGRGGDRGQPPGQRPRRAPRARARSAWWPWSTRRGRT